MIPALGEQRQEDEGLKVSHSYMICSRLVCALKKREKKKERKKLNNGCILLLQRTRIPFLAPMLGGLQPPIILGNLMPSSGHQGHLHSHTHTQTHNAYM